MNRVAKFLAYDGKVSLICTNTTELVEEVRKLHDLTPRSEEHTSELQSPR